MVNLIENRDFGVGAEEFGADVPITPQENFVNGVYSSVDEAAACGLDIKQNPAKNHENLH